MAIAEFRTRGILSDDAYAVERSAILDGLLPLESERRRAMLADAAPALEELVALGLISGAEALAEWEAATLPEPVPSWAELVAQPGDASAPPPLPTAKPDKGSQPEPEPTDPVAGTVGLHLASFRTPEQADLGWSQILAANGDVLASLRSRIVEVDHGADTGVFFEVRAGPLPNEAAAHAACDALIACGLYCATLPF